MISLEEALRDKPVYALPTLMQGEGQTLESVSDGVSAFKYAGNWYASPRINGVISLNPDHWSLVVANTDSDWNLRHYHAPNMSAAMNPGHLSQLIDIADGLEAKSRAGILESMQEALTPAQMRTIILAKEKEGKGFQPGNGEPLHGFIEKHGLEPFKATEEEISRANTEVPHADGVNQERLLLKMEAGDAFEIRPRGGLPGEALSNPRKRLFFAFDKRPAPESQTLGVDASGGMVEVYDEAHIPLRRIEVGFDEVLHPDGKRTYQPRVTEIPTTLSEVIREIGDQHIVNAPQDITEFIHGDNAGLARYAKRDLAERFRARQVAEDYVRRTEGIRHASMVCPNFGEEVEGVKLTNQAWYRVMRESDYVPEPVMVSGSGLVEASPKILHPNRADYFLIHKHPNHLASREAPEYELLFLKGDPQGNAPQIVEKIPCATHEDVFFALHERGIHHDSKLIKLGQEEYTDMFHARNLGTHINDSQLKRETAKDTRQHEILEYFDPRSQAILSEPITLAAGKLTDLSQLSENTLYKLGDSHYLVLSRSAEKESPRIHLFEKTTEGFRTLPMMNNVQGGEFEFNLVNLLHQQGSLSNASVEETVDLMRYCKAFNNIETHLSECVTYRNLGNAAKPVLSGDLQHSLQQEAAGTLESNYIKYLRAARKDSLAASHRGKGAGTGRVTDAAAPSSSPHVVEAASRPEGENVAEKIEKTAANDAKSARSWASRFMEEEKWVGKKGMVVAGGAAALGAVIYSAKKYIDSHTDPEGKEAWQAKVEKQPDPNTRGI